MRSFAIRAKRWWTGCGSVPVVAICVGLFAPGCSFNEKVKVASNGAPEYQNLQIAYDLASTPDIRHVDPPTKVEQTAHVELASNIQSALPPERPWTRRRVHLELQYPYPGIHPAFARATLRIVTDSRKNKPEETMTWGLRESFSGTPVTYSLRTPGGMTASKPAKKAVVEPSTLPPDDQGDLISTEEILYIDLPKTELDGVLTELAKGDFFRVASNPDGASHLLVVVNKGRCEKGWSRDEHLDRLVDLLRQHGAPLAAPTDADPKKS
ncbi:MAG TPA: hypothetical protein VGP63_05855 [Planctomycetaceae bacterium]|nr:hypothetical protein [Planctomycetaceae bacterium]